MGHPSRDEWQLLPVITRRRRPPLQAAWSCLQTTSRGTCNGPEVRYQCQTRFRLVMCGSRLCLGACRCAASWPANLQSGSGGTLETLRSRHHELTRSRYSRCRCRHHMLHTMEAFIEKWPGRQGRDLNSCWHQVRRHGAGSRRRQQQGARAPRRRRSFLPHKSVCHLLLPLCTDEPAPGVASSGWYSRSMLGFPCWSSILLKEAAYNVLKRFGFGFALQTGHVCRRAGHRHPCTKCSELQL